MPHRHCSLTAVFILFRSCSPLNCSRVKSQKSTAFSLDQLSILGRTYRMHPCHSRELMFAQKQVLLGKKQRRSKAG
ncbi:hypothetical protein BC939DRAFT_433943 [Gamsiella multidivaricata]|uniref:uncharacterized protein n=1 Tax=Gamsiella multidivaricata TaxID=101098 RepID=UPI00221EA7E4|nr:uncharacterized protein BC939DRAFT_433943 [Gamsiella multidivaricata]KAI7832636.1 hypothetical protein BC939DRAFT_433943 [Gamsiella multidivaricata]